MNKERAFTILDKIKTLGFEEYWPPSQTSWYFFNKTKRVSLTFHWPTYSFRGHLIDKSIKWSKKHNRYIAI